MQKAVWVINNWHENVLREVILPFVEKTCLIIRAWSKKESNKNDLKKTDILPYFLTNRFYVYQNMNFMIDNRYFYLDAK